MLIKSIYKGKKNLYVVETFNSTDNVYFEIFEFNFKLRQFNHKKYLKEVKKDYLKSKCLKLITYQEFENEFVKVYLNTTKKFNSLFEKFLNYANETNNPEYRHFMYEYRLNNTPMLTEGLLKILAYSNKALEISESWNDFAKEFTSRFELEQNINIEIPQKLIDFKEIINYGFTTATVNKGKYIFDFEVSDELPLDEEEQTQNVQVQFNFENEETEAEKQND